MQEIVYLTVVVSVSHPTTNPHLEPAHNNKEREICREVGGREIESTDSGGVTTNRGRRPPQGGVQYRYRGS